MKRKLKKNCKPFVLVSLILASLVYGGIPDWFKSHQHAKYPSSRFIIGVGSGNTRETAIGHARADIVNQIEVKISSITEIRDYEKDTEAGTVMQSSISSIIKSEAEEVLPGIQIVEVKKSKDTFYALAVLDKVKYTEKLYGEIEKLSGEIDNLKKSAFNLMRKGKFGLAIAEFDTIFDMIPDIIIRNNTYSAITGNVLPQAGKYSPGQISSELKELLGNVSLRILNPTGWKAVLGNNLSPPLSVRAIFTTNNEETGLEGVPLTLEYESGEIAEKNTTDPNGFCSFDFVIVPTGNDNKTGKVRVKFEVDKLSELITDYLKGVYVEYSYTVETPIKSFSIHITDAGGSQYPDFEQYLKQRLSEFGLEVSRTSSYIIEGRVMVTADKEIKTPLAKMVYVELTIDLEIQNKANGSIVSTTKVKTSGLGKSYHDAIKTAIKNIDIDRLELAKFIGKVFR